MATKKLKNSDIFLVNRDKKSHRALVGQMKDYFGYGVLVDSGEIAPIVEVLTPLDGAGLNEGQDFNPATDVIKKVENDVVEVFETDTIASVTEITSVTYRYVVAVANDCRTLNWSDAVDQQIVNIGVSPPSGADVYQTMWKLDSPATTTYLNTGSTTASFNLFKSETGQGDWVYDSSGVSSSTIGAISSSSTATYWLAIRVGSGSGETDVFPDRVKADQVMTRNGYYVTADGNITLTFPTANNFDKWAVGDVVQSNEANWVFDNGLPPRSDTLPDADTADRSKWDYNSNNTREYTWESGNLALNYTGQTPGVRSYIVMYQPSADDRYTYSGDIEETDAQIKAIPNQSGLDGLPTVGGVGTVIYFTPTKINGTFNILASSRIGYIYGADIGKDTSPASIVSIDDSNPYTITVDGGSWYGNEDGSGDAGDGRYEPSQVWSGYTYGEDENGNKNNLRLPATNAFDGNPSTTCQSDNTNNANYIVFNYPEGIDVNTGFQFNIQTSTPGDKVYSINGGAEVAVDGNGLTTTSFTGTLKKFTIRSTNTNGGIDLQNLIVDAKELIDSSIPGGQGDTKLVKQTPYDVVLTVNGEKELEYFNQLDRVDMGLTPYQPVSDAIMSVTYTDPNDYTFGGTVETTFANVDELYKMFNDDITSTSTGRFTGSQNVGGGTPYKGYVRVALPKNHQGQFEIQTAYSSSSSEPTSGLYFKTDIGPSYRSYAGSPFFTSSGTGSRGIFRWNGSRDAKYIEVGSDINGMSAGVWSVHVDGNQVIYPAQTIALTGDTDLKYFREGDEVQPNVSIRHINDQMTPPTITFNGNGSWLDIDGNGDSGGETEVTCISPLKEPTDWIVQGVQADGTNSKLYLNATTKDNSQVWVVDDNQASQPFYVVNQRLITGDAPDANDIVFTSQNANTVEFNAEPPASSSLVKRIWHLASSNLINTIDDASITTYDEILDVEEGEDPGEWARDPNLITNGKYYKVGVQYEDPEGNREPEIVTDFHYFKTKSRNKYYPVSSVITDNVSDTEVETQNDDEHHVLGGDLVMVTDPTDDQNPPIVAHYTPTSSSILSIGSDGSNIVLNVEDEQDLKYFRPGDILPESSSVFDPSKTMTFSKDTGRAYAHNAAGGAKMLSAAGQGVEGPDKGWPSIGDVTGNVTATMNVYFNPPLTFDPPVKIGVVGHETAGATGGNDVKRGVGVNGNVYLFKKSGDTKPPAQADGSAWHKVAYYHTWSNISTLTSVQARVQGYNGMESRYGKCSTYGIYVNDEQLIEEDIVPVVVSVNIDDENGNSITVDAGEWYANPANGGNGDGVDTAPDIVVGSPVTGEATDVVSTNGNTLTLQGSNDRWIGNDNRQGLNFYVAKKDIYESGTLFYSEKDNDVIGEETIKARYGARSANIDLTKLGICELTEQPLTSVAGYVKQGQKYQPVYDLVPKVKDLKSRLGI